MPNKLQQLTIRIEDVETLLDEVSSEAYDKAVEQGRKGSGTGYP